MNRNRLVPVIVGVLISSISASGHGLGQHFQFKPPGIKWTPAVVLNDPRSVEAKQGSTALQNEIRMLAAVSNSNDSPSLARAAYAAYSSLYSDVQSIKTHATTASSGSTSDADRTTLQTTVDDLIRNINHKALSIEWNGIPILKGTTPVPLSNEGYYSSSGQPNNSATGEPYEAGTPAGTPWERIADAVTNLSSGDQTVTFTYSFMQSGAEVGGAGDTTLSSEFGSEDLAAAAFKQEISEALTVWEDLIERSFNPAHGYGGSLEIQFVNLGDETLKSVGSYTSLSEYPIPGEGNLGDFRYAMEDYDGIGPGYPLSPSGTLADGYGDGGGDIHYNTNITWRTDRSARLSGVAGTSVKIVSAHEMGHIFCFVHDTTTGVVDLTSYPKALMNPAVITQNSIWELYPLGLYEQGPSEKAGLVDMYGRGATLTTPNSILFDDGTIMDLPAVNAATLRISSVKVRTLDEGLEAGLVLDGALNYLSGRMNAMQAIMSNSGPTPTGPPTASLGEVGATRTIAVAR